MTSRQRNFGATKRVSEFEPLDFTLNDVTFNCRPALQGAVLLRFVSESNSGDPSKSAEAVTNFFRTAMTAESFAAFEEMSNSEEIIIEMETITEIAQWLIEQYTERPTKGSKA